ncbi:MAG: hypothetical protein GXO39_00135 [Thermotogae bacterium]|nr:hypothetical protein [Thermotogota bacterium]
MVISLLSLGDPKGAQVEALRLGNSYLYAKALAAGGDTLGAINVLMRLKDCKAKRYMMVLSLAKFYLETTEDLLKDSLCFTGRDRILFRAYTLNFTDDPLSDSLKAILPPLLDPSKALLFNLIPGGGLLYTGKPWQGLKTFLAVSVGLAGITYSIKKKHYVDAIIWYLFWENRFLMGSFQNTLSSVWEENRRRLKPYFERILKMLEEGSSGQVENPMIPEEKN